MMIVLQKPDGDRVINPDRSSVRDMFMSWTLDDWVEGSGDATLEAKEKTERDTVLLIMPNRTATMFYLKFDYSENGRTAEDEWLSLA